MINIGFNSNIYHVNESDGTVLLTVQVLEGTFNEGVSVHVRLTTLSGSANGDQYDTISSEYICNNSFQF